MNLIIPVVCLGASALLGLFLGWQYLSHVRSKPVHIAVHLILGMAGLEMMGMLLRGTPEGVVAEAGSLGRTAGTLLVGAVFVGFITPLIARNRPRETTSMVLAGHVALGLAGVALFLVWASKL